MSQTDRNVHVFVNHARYWFEPREQTGRAIKERGCVPLDHVLCLEVGHQHSHDECGCDRNRHGAELKVVDDDQMITLENGQHFWSHVAASHGIIVTINRKEYEFADPHQTSRSLKERAGIALTDVLFLDRPHEDEVIADDTKIVLKCEDCFHSAPPANYGAPQVATIDVGFNRFEILAQPDGWTFVVVPDYPLPDCFSPVSVRLLVKLPPTFPDAAPDMFWLNPQVRTASACAPQGTSIEMLLGAQWQRFSWHLLPGAWRPGTSTLRDYMRCIRTRLEKRN